MVVLKVSNQLSICSSCAILADEIGWPGGEAVFTNSYPYSPGGARARNGFGPGGGLGGRGVFGGAHGGGGGGGSMQTKVSLRAAVTRIAFACILTIVT